MTLMVIARCAVRPCESLSWTVKVELPAVVGDPEITPVLLLKVSPRGSEPLAIDHVYGVVPPVPCNS